MVDKELVRQTIALLRDKLADIEERRSKLNRDADDTMKAIREWESRLATSIDGQSVENSESYASAPVRKLPKGKMKKLLLEFFKNNPGEWTPTEIAQKTGMNASSIRYAMTKAVNEFEKDDEGVWRRIHRPSAPDFDEPPF
ncbi:MAG: hypothetical protein GC168_16600 [Candidatus Hydrogenedens sp.]|nr:hypothetical protein [Candidatus Hydrogenedens sp.]